MEVVVGVARVDALQGCHDLIGFVETVLMGKVYGEVVENMGIVRVQLQGRTVEAFLLSVVSRAFECKREVIVPQRILWE